jgi:hypothetical protein
MPSTGMLRHVGLITTDVSGGRVASNCKVERISEMGMLALAGRRRL